MKPLVRKILESGLVEKSSVALMEKWGQLDHGSTELVGKNDLKTATESALLAFAEEVEGLIETERETSRETRLDVRVGEPFLAWWPGHRDTKMVLYNDTMGHFIFPLRQEINLHPGAVFFTLDDTKWVVTSFDTLTMGDHPYFIQVTATDSRAG